MLDLDLEGVHVLISGANGGIGLPTSKLFLRECTTTLCKTAVLLTEQGAKVTAQYNSTSRKLDADAELQAYGAKGAYQALQADVADEKAVDDLFDRAEKGMQGDIVKVLVVNHGISNDEPNPISRMTLAQFNHTHAVNLTGSFLLIRRYLQSLERVKAETSLEALGENVAVVMIGSTAAEFGEANNADYASSKAGLTHGLMLSLKNEIVKIHPRARVNTVAPGWVETPMAEKAMADPAIKYQAMATTPLNKIATPEDIANQVVVLASQNVSGHVTGQIVMLHGGMEGRLLNPK